MRGGFLKSCDGPWSNVPRERKMAGKRGGKGRGEDKEQDSSVRMVSREGRGRGGEGNSRFSLVTFIAGDFSDPTKREPLSPTVIVST